MEVFHYPDHWGVGSTGVTFTAGETYEIKVVVAFNVMTLYVDGVFMSEAVQSPPFGLSQPAPIVANAPVYVAGDYQAAAKATLSDIYLKEIAAPTP